MSKMTLNKLAELIKKGFDETASKSDVAELSRKVGNLEIGHEQLTKKVSNLEIGQEDILLKLDNYAYKFEVNELKKRVTKTEGRLNTLESKEK